jgi:hypothetical protein
LRNANLASMVVDSEMMLEHGKNWSPYVLSADSISAHPTPFPHSMPWASLHRLIIGATRGVMEILGLDPYQSQTQYLGLFDRDSMNRKYSGNLFPLYFLFTSTLFPLPFFVAGIAEIKRKYVSASEAHKINGGNICDDGHKPIETLLRQAGASNFCRRKENVNAPRSGCIFALLEGSFISCNQRSDRRNYHSSPYFNWSQEADLAQFPA